MTGCKLTDENSILTCIHVVDNKKPLYYVPKTDPGFVESATCLECLEEQDLNKLCVVCKDCFEKHTGVKVNEINKGP